MCVYARLGVSTRAPGYRVSHQVPPTPESFSITVYGRPARLSITAASSPPKPAPMTITENSLVRGARHAGARTHGSSPSSSRQYSYSASSSSSPNTSGMLRRSRSSGPMSTGPAPESRSPRRNSAALRRSSATSASPATIMNVWNPAGSTVTRVAAASSSPVSWWRRPRRTIGSAWATARSICSSLASRNSEATVATAFMPGSAG
jgi:hypothetical protein